MGHWSDLILIAIILRMYEWDDLNLAWWFILGMKFPDDVYQIWGMWRPSWKGMDGMAWNLEQYYANTQYICVYIEKDSVGFGNTKLRQA